MTTVDPQEEREGEVQWDYFKEEGTRWSNAIEALGITIPYLLEKDALMVNPSTTKLHKEIEEDWKTSVRYFNDYVFRSDYDNGEHSRFYPVEEFEN